MVNERDELMQQCDELEARRRELLSRHNGESGVRIEAEPWYEELVLNERQQEILRLAIGAYEVLLSPQEP